MVRKGGFEPPRSCERQPLKRSRSEARRTFVRFSGSSCPSWGQQTPPRPARLRIRCTTVAHDGPDRCWQQLHSRGRWRKQEDIAAVRLANGNLRRAELHWYEAHGIGRRDIKIKTYVDEP